jgi:hypothetical protein
MAAPTTEQVRSAHSSALAEIVSGPDYRLPVPTSFEVLSCLRRMGCSADRWTVIAACVREGLCLTDSPGANEPNKA